MSHRVLNPQQFDLAQELGLHPSLGGSQVPHVLKGRAAFHVMHQADIRQTHPKVEMPHIANAGFDIGRTYEQAYPRGEVWTSQRHLHTPTLVRYAQGDIPEHEWEWPTEDDEEKTPYHPETYEHGGREWLLEGHHRTVATRLSRRT
jgi:hypothetical protein